MKIENEILEYALRDGIKQMNQNLENGDFSRLASGFVKYRDIRDLVNVNKDNIKQSEKELVENITKQLYSFLLSNPMAFVFAMSKVKLKSAPVTVRDYSSIILETSKFMKLFYHGIQNEFKTGCPQHFYLFFNSPEQVEALGDVIKVVDTFVPFFKSATKAESVYSDKYIGVSEFSRLIEILNGKMESSLVNASGMMKNWENVGDVDEATYKSLVEGFKDLSKGIVKSAKEISDSQAKPQKQSKPSSEVISAEEQLRLQTINQANCLYDELVNDTMRDLKAQVPYSARDMYAYFVGVKFEKFVKEHKMPLAKSTPLKQAQDVVAKLNGLFNYVSKISENSRVSIVYGNDMLQ